MSSTYIGYNGTSLVTETSYDEDVSGLATYTKKTLVMPSVNVVTPNLNQTTTVSGQTLRLVSVNVTSGSGNFKQITEVYQGPSSTRTLQQNSVNSTGEEPIETNYNFLVGHDGSDSIVQFSGGALTAGYANTSTTGGAVFDTDGSFLFFNDKAKYNLCGVKSYLNPNLTYRRSFTTSTTPSLTSVGKIVNSASDFPSSVSGGTWLCTGIQYVQRGAVFEVSQDFRCSDRKGWNPYVYGNPVSAPASQ
jgi:hypothetical protein